MSDDPERWRGAFWSVLDPLPRNVGLLGCLLAGIVTIVFLAGALYVGAWTAWGAWTILHKLPWPDW